MAYNEELASLMRLDLTDHHPVVEKRMFGGLCFMYRGNMLCGIHPKGAMYRVGKDNLDAALNIQGAEIMGFTGRPMKAFIDVGEDAFRNSTKRLKWLSLATAFCDTLPAK